MKRRLIVCSDGTWNTPDRMDDGVFAPSNVVKIARAILPQAPDGTPQIVFYDPGVGTENILDKYSGGAFGFGLTRNVEDAYRFLIQNYAQDDEIYFFGFSRGAYTVRSAAGLIRKCGLPHKRHAAAVREAFTLYRTRDDSPDTERAKGFREKYSWHPVPIKFIGVWDTVGSLGIPGGLFRSLGRKRFEFHSVSLSKSVKHAYQALAVDEKRSFFKPSLWEADSEAEDQVLEQAWFAGVHMDVGGGYKESGLSNEAFLWMKEKAKGADLEFDEQYVGEMVGNPLGQLHESRVFPYTLFGSHTRPIGAGQHSHESVHEAARKRHEGDGSYRPKNLVSFLEKQASAGQPALEEPDAP